MTYYSIQQVSEMTQIPATTLRYYDKQGLLPFLERSEAGYRVFQKKDLGSLQIIQCLKSAGLSIVEIRQFFQWVQEGDTSLKERLTCFSNAGKKSSAKWPNCKRPGRHQLQM